MDLTSSDNVNGQPIPQALSDDLQMEGSMEPIVIEQPEMILVGFDFFGDPFKFSVGWTEENEIGRLWKRFMAYFDQYKGQLKHIKDASVMYEVHIEHPETPQTGEYEVFVGLEVEKLEHVPVEITVKVIPAALYVVFTLKGEQITSDWSKLVYEDWMPGSGFQPSSRYGMQCYDERFKGLDRIEESELKVYIPIKKVESSN
jgi:predicted transcriptional regulator YdeE